jgi:predicted nucleic acid-binding protein
VIVADPKDDAVIACAIGGNADYIISGDRHLLTLGQYRSIPIWDVTGFLASRMEP